MKDFKALKTMTSRLFYYSFKNLYNYLIVAVSVGNGVYLSLTEQGFLSQEFDLMFFYK